jgi:peptidyl-prolyl cis-trans isomerase B (cyclophilin B)
MGKKKIKKKDTARINRPVVVVIAVLCVVLLAVIGYGAYQAEVAGKRPAPVAAEDAAKTDKLGQPDAGQTTTEDSENTQVVETGKEAGETQAENGDVKQDQAPQQQEAGDTAAKEDNVTNANEGAETKRVSVKTGKGKIELEIYPKLMPITTANFEKLINAKFYDGLTFHRVENWVIQGGDPQGTGMGGPGWSIKLETNPQLKNVRGAVAMARSQDPDSAGSQFYILKEDASWLDGDYAVFGRVTSGMDVVDRIAVGDKMQEVKIK